MNLLLENKIIILVSTLVLILSFLIAPFLTLADFNQQINYQGKLTNSSGVAVEDGTYNMNFWLIASSTAATSTAVWAETRVGGNKVQVTNGLFSVMLGEVSSLSGVNFDQTLYLGVEIGGPGSPVWDGEMTPRKILGAVPAAFEAQNSQTLGNLATTSFLRADDSDTMEATSSSALLTLIQNGAGKILSLFSGATEMFTVLNNGNIGIATTTPSEKLTVVGNTYLGGGLTLTGAFKDSTIATGTLGMILQTTGTSTQWKATSTLGLGNGTFLGLTDTPSSFTANRLMFTNSGGTALTDSASLVFDGTNLGIGTTTPNNLLQVYDLINFNNIASSTQLGFQAGKNIVSGAQYNTFIGYQAGYSSSTASTNAADYNTAVGYQSLFSNTTGYYNTANGMNSLTGNTTGSYNAANGFRSLYSNTTGSYNTANGAYSLYLNSTGSNNAANGTYSLFYNITGSNNIAEGYNAGRHLTNGSSPNASTSNSIFLGYDTRASIDGGINEIVIGASAIGNGSNSVTLGSTTITKTILQGNVGIATTTPTEKLTVVGNTYLGGGLTLTGAFKDSTNATGTLGMVLQTTGTSTRWVATSTLGITSGASTFLSLTDTPSSFTANRLLFTNSGGTALTDSASLVFDGTNLGIGSTTPSSKLTVVGKVDITNIATSSAIITLRDPIGNIAMEIRAGTSTLYNTFSGVDAGFANNTGSDNTAFGYRALFSNTTGSDNTAIGWRSLYNNISGLDNTAIGSHSLYNNISGDFNTAIGRQSLFNNATGTANTGLGTDSLYGNTSGNYNTAIGRFSLYTNISGSNNTATGYQSLYSNLIGTSNVANGYQALYNNTASHNVGVGLQALYSNVSGDDNVALGYKAGLNLTSANNILIGYQAADNLTTGANNIAIGFDIDLASTTRSNQLNIGNLIFGTGVDGTGTTLSSGNIGIGTSTPVSRLAIEKLNFSGSGIAGINQYFTFNNSVASAVQYGNFGYLYATNTATTTLVGNMFKLEDSTLFGNTVRGFEVQTDRGTNTLGENTALSGFARTFGVRGTTKGDAGGTYEPAGIYGETQGYTQGNAIRGYSSTITTASLLKLFQDSSTFTGTGLLMNFGNTGGSFSSTTASKFIDLQNAGTSMFTVGAYGKLTIGDGTTAQNAGIQVGYGGICVDNDGSCNASTTGRISAVSYHTGNSDLAETYFSNENLKAGEIVYIKNGLSIGRAGENNKDKVIGVVSTKPGLLLGFDDTSLKAGEKSYPIALKGRVPIRLSDENGEVKAGDELMLSSIEGVAMKASSTGKIIGVALEDYSGSQAYSDTYINQFGDDLVDPVFEPINKDNDPRINDGCYFGGGNASGEEVCKPLLATSTDGRVVEAQALAKREAEERELARLANIAAERVNTVNGQEVKVGQIVMFVDLRNRSLDEVGAEMITALMAKASTTDSEVSETVWQRLVNLANNFVDGVLSVFTLKADKVEVKDQLCVDGVCVTGDDLRQLLNRNNSSNNDSGNSSNPPPVTNQENNQVEESSTDEENNLEVSGESEPVAEETVDENTVLETTVELPPDPPEPVPDSAPDTETESPPPVAPIP